jgi:hypothetical protein
MIGSGHQECQLVEGGGARLQGAAPLEQEQAQLFAPSSAAGNAQALAAEQPPRGQRRVDQIALAAFGAPAGAGARTRPR